MEVNLLGTKGYYTIKEGTEHASKGSIVGSYVKLVTFSVGFCLLGVAAYSFTTLTTSFNAEQLGSFSLASLYTGFLLSLFLTPSLVDIIGAKACAICSGFLTLVYSVSYFHPTWYTLIPSSAGMGIGWGLLYTASGTIKSDEVQKCVERFKVDPVTYQGRFSAIIGVGVGMALCLSGIVSFGILSFTDSDNSGPNGSCVVNVVNTSLRDNTSSTAAVVSPAVYFTLVTAMSGVSLLCIFTMSIMRGAAYHQCRVCSFKLKAALRNTVTRAVKVVKQACTPAYGLILPLRMNQGFVASYIFGVFTKRYVADCVGVEYVGVAIAVRGAFGTVGSFGSGWLMRYTTSYMMVLVCIGGLEVGSLIFLITWERQPSFEVIIILSAVFGLCHGLNATVALAYSGTAPGDSVTGYNVLVVEHSGSHVIQYILSEFISPETNLYVILVITILAVPLFTIADIHYGSGTSRNICGKKKLSVAVVENGNIQSEPASGSQENTSSIDNPAPCGFTDGVGNTEKVVKFPLVESGSVY